MEQTRSNKAELQVPFSVYESMMDHHRHLKKWLISVIILLIICLTGTNICWICLWSQYDTVTTEYVQDGKGTNVIGNGNEVQYESVSRN